MKTNEAFILSNFLHSVSKDCKGKLGYAVARNIRILDTDLTEYNNVRNELIKKYGKTQDNNVVIENGSEEYKKFMEEIKQYEDIEVNVELMKVSREILEESNLSADVLSPLIEYMEE